MKAIRVTYHGPTNTRGSRFTARAEGVRALTRPYTYALSPDENARLAAEALCRRQNWGGILAGGTLPDGSRCFVFVGDDARAVPPAEVA